MDDDTRTIPFSLSNSLITRFCLRSKHGWFLCRTIVRKNIALGSDLEEGINPQVVDIGASYLRSVAGFVDALHILKNSVTITPTTEREYDWWEPCFVDISYTNLSILELSRTEHSNNINPRMIPLARCYKNPDPYNRLDHGTVSKIRIFTCIIS